MGSLAVKVRERASAARSRRSRSPNALKSAQPSSSLRARSVVTLSTIAPFRRRCRIYGRPRRGGRFEPAIIIVEAVRSVQGANRPTANGGPKKAYYVCARLNADQRFRRASLGRAYFLGSKMARWIAGWHSRLPPRPQTRILAYMQEIQFQ